MRWKPTNTLKSDDTHKKNMKTLGIAFNAKRGNCLDCVEYVLAKLREQRFETEVINLYDYEIKPHSHCNYECFALQLRGKEEECPIQNDVLRIYHKMKEVDIITFVVPTYGSKAAGLHCAFTEERKELSKAMKNSKTRY